MVISWHGPLARYVKLRPEHAPGMPGTFSPPPRVSDPDMHYGTCVTRVPWCMTGSLTCGFFWSRWRVKRSRHSRCMHNPKFYISARGPLTRHAVSSMSGIHHISGEWIHNKSTSHILSRWPPTPCFLCGQKITIGHLCFWSVQFYRKLVANTTKLTL